MELSAEEMDNKAQVFVSLKTKDMNGAKSVLVNLSFIDRSVLIKSMSKPFCCFFVQSPGQGFDIVCVIQGHSAVNSQGVIQFL